MNNEVDTAAACAAALTFAVPPNRWIDADAAATSTEQLLLYRSNLLGADLCVTNFGGGNTSAKIAQLDPLTRSMVEVLWVKGSGGDLGSMALDGFSTLSLERFHRIEALYRGEAFEDEMVGYLPHCTFNLNPRAASIDTPLHGLLPFTHIDHVHPDAVIAMAASSGGEAAVRDLWRGQVGWLAWRRPGFQLALTLRRLVEDNPGLRGVVLAGHGLICWGGSAKACYDNTIDLIGEAASYLNSRLAKRAAFGGARCAQPPALLRGKHAADLMPRLRARLSGAVSKVGHHSDDPEVMEFVNSSDFERLAALGTSCPDHFLRTKVAPLALQPEHLDDDAYLAERIAQYRRDYADYYHRCAGPAAPGMRDANPVVVLVPGLGRFTFAGDKTTARLAGEFYGNAINVMRGAEALGDYIGLAEQEAFNIEYWDLEEAKLQRQPKPKSLAGKIALITGGAGGIGQSTAARLLGEGACVMLLDVDAGELGSVQTALQKRFGPDVVRSVVCDVTNEVQIQAAFDALAREFGGLDILVVNAGIASAASIEETTLELWRRNHNVLAEGYFLTARAAFPLLRLQGGSIVFIGSKNALAATSGASAYASAKAASLHLARCLALEGAPDGVRVNVVNPDAVIRGSRIWDGGWREARAGAYGVDAGDGLESYYRDRSLLKRSVLPGDVADAVFFFASDASSKSTGNILNVDAGNAQAFPR
jgi:rhamnulose-1-phosphate aldolase/alcohol dehydrogenase